MTYIKIISTVSLFITITPAFAATGSHTDHSDCRAPTGGPFTIHIPTVPEPIPLPKPIEITRSPLAIELGLVPANIDRIIQPLRRSEVMAQRFAAGVLFHAEVEGAVRRKFPEITGDSFGVLVNYLLTSESQTVFAQRWQYLLGD